MRRCDAAHRHIHGSQLSNLLSVPAFSLCRSTSCCAISSSERLVRCWTSSTAASPSISATPTRCLAMHKPKRCKSNLTRCCFTPILRCVCGRRGVVCGRLPHWMTCGVRRLQVTLCPDKKYVVVQPGNINKGSFVTWLLADPSVVPITVDDDAMSSGQPSSSGPDAAVESPESSRSAPPSDSGGSLSFGAGEAPPSPELGAVAAAGEVLAVTARAEAAPSTTERAAASSGSGRSLPDLAGLVATPPPPLPPPQQSRRGRPRGDTAQSAWSLLSGSGVPRGAVLARCWWCH